MLRVPPLVVMPISSVPAAAARRADSMIWAVTASELFGLTTRSFIVRDYSKSACSVHHGHDLDLDELLRLAQLQHRDVRRRGLVVVRAEVRVDDGGGLADVAHARAGAQDEDVHDVLEAGTGRLQRLLDAVHGGPGLRLEMVRHVLEDFFAT